MESQVNHTLRQLDFGLDTRRAFEARMVELGVLARELKPKSNKLTMQQLPRFMRRRAASHNPKRLPSKRRTKVVAGKGASSQTGQKGRTKQRTKRMKHLGLRRKRYSIRCRNRKEDRHLLHIWFRKRFAMRSLLGLRLPSHNNTKNFRNLHQKSAQKCVYFHLPLYEYLHVRCTTQQQLQPFFRIVARLTDHRERTDLRLCLLKRKELTLDFVVDQRWNSFFKIIHTHQPADQLADGSHDFLIVAPLLTHWILFDQFKVLCSDESIQVFQGRQQFQRFRLIGPEAVQKLSQVCLQWASRDECVTGDEIKSIESIGKGQVKMCLNADAFYDGPANQLSVLLINQPLDSRAHCLDVVVPSRCAKRFWYSLVRNRSHLVGGLRDLLYLAMERNQLCFPFTGSCDRVNGGGEVEDGNGEKRDQLFAIDDHRRPQSIRQRNHLTIERQVTTLETLNKTTKNLYTDLGGAVGSQQQLLTCKIQMWKRGIAKKGDFLFLPTVEDVVQLWSRTRKRSCEQEEGGANDFEPVEKVKLRHLRTLTRQSLDRMSRNAIGLVEYGEFSLHSGKGEAVGLIWKDSIDQLVRNHRQAVEQLSKGQSIDRSAGKGGLFVLTRNENSNQFRFAVVQSIGIRSWFI